MAIQNAGSTTVTESRAAAAPYKLPPVSSRYRLDWQYAVGASRLPLLRPASIIISVMPLAMAVSNLLLGEQISLPWRSWIVWAAAVTFFAAWLLLVVACPPFIQQYRHFGDFAAYQHSHRWICWLFYQAVASRRSKCKFCSRDAEADHLVRESKEKGLLTEVVNDTIPQSVHFENPPSGARTHVSTPANIGRDLYVPLLCDGLQYVLCLKEADPELPKKEKELFWILYSQEVKTRLWPRRIFWWLLGLSVLLLLANVASNILSVVKQVKG